jgi:hypothetical protein
LSWGRRHLHNRSKQMMNISSRPRQPIAGERMTGSPCPSPVSRTEVGSRNRSRRARESSGPRRPRRRDRAAIHDVRSEFDPLRNAEGIIDFDAEITDRAFELGVSKQKLNRPQVAGLFVDLGCLRPPHRMRAVGRAIKPSPIDPKMDDPAHIGVSRGAAGRGSGSGTDTVHSSRRPWIASLGSMLGSVL